jgi:RNA polymerase sigma factor FliA
MDAIALETAELSLWLKLREAGDAKARDALIVKYAPWARNVARGVYVRVYLLKDAWEDCAQNALIGLMESVDRFQPDRGVSFQAFAKHRVRGAVFNGLRVIKEDLAKTGRRSDDDARDRTRSLMDSDGDSIDPLENFVSMTVGLGLGYLLESNSVPISADASDAYSCAERDQLSQTVLIALDQLPERERLILTMHYFHHVPFVRIAAELKVTKGRVSQLHKQGLARLREVLGKKVNDVL